MLFALITLTLIVLLFLAAVSLAFFGSTISTLNIVLLLVVPKGMLIILILLHLPVGPLLARLHQI